MLVVATRCLVASENSKKKIASMLVKKECRNKDSPYYSCGLATPYLLGSIRAVYAVRVAVAKARADPVHALPVDAEGELPAVLGRAGGVVLALGARVAHARGPPVGPLGAVRVRGALHAGVARALGQVGVAAAVRVLVAGHAGVAHAVLVVGVARAVRVPVAGDARVAHALLLVGVARAVRVVPALLALAADAPGAAVGVGGAVRVRSAVCRAVVGCHL